MAQVRKVEGQVEIKCDADKFFHVWARNSDQISKICPHVYTDIQLEQGHSWNTLGAIINFHYISPLDGKSEVVKARVEEIDEEKRSVTYKIMDGDAIRKFYKTFKDKIEVIPKGENGSIVKWSVVEYEPRNEFAPDPQLFIATLLSCAKDMDRHLSSSA